jgi:hypothetical protein
MEGSETSPSPRPAPSPCLAAASARQLPPMVHFANFCVMYWFAFTKFLVDVPQQASSIGAMGLMRLKSICRRSTAEMLRRYWWMKCGKCEVSVRRVKGLGHKCLLCCIGTG